MDIIVHGLQMNLADRQDNTVINQCANVVSDCNGTQCTHILMLAVLYFYML